MSQQKVLKEALQNIEKQFGKGAIMRMWDNKWVGSINTYHTGSYVLDSILGWGLPEWRVVEIYGPESSGKTTITLHMIAEIQRQWGVAAFIDAEHALDPQYAAWLGVDVDNLLLAQPDYGEQALEIAQELAKSGAVKLIVVDSVAAMTPKAEVEGDMGQSHMGLQARMMSQGLRKLTAILSKTWTTIIFINQLRMKIGVMFGNPEVTTGGNALKFYASQRIEIRRWQKLTENKEDYGYIAKIKVVKNKVAPPFKKAEIPVLFGTWYDMTADLIEIAMTFGFITRAGAFYTYKDTKTQGKEKLINFLNENWDVKEVLAQEVTQEIKNIRMWKRAAPDTVGIEESSNWDNIEEVSVDDIVGDIK